MISARHRHFKNLSLRMEPDPDSANASRSHSFLYTRTVQVFSQASACACILENRHMHRTPLKSIHVIRVLLRGYGSLKQDPSYQPLTQTRYTKLSSLPNANKICTKLALVGDSYPVFSSSHRGLTLFSVQPQRAEHHQHYFQCCWPLPAISVSSCCYHIFCWGTITTFTFSWTCLFWVNFQRHQFPCPLTTWCSPGNWKKKWYSDHWHFLFSVYPSNTENVL